MKVDCTECRVLYDPEKKIIYFTPQETFSDLSGEVIVDSFICKSATKDFYIPEIKIRASNEDKNKKIENYLQETRNNFKHTEEDIEILKLSLKDMNDKLFKREMESLPGLVDYGGELHPLK